MGGAAELFGLKGGCEGFLLFTLPEAGAAGFDQHVAQVGAAAAPLQLFEFEQRRGRRDIGFLAGGGQRVHEIVLVRSGMGQRSPAQEQQAKKEAANDHVISKRMPTIVTSGNV